MSKLLGKDPATVEPRKPQMMIFGPTGVGKTWFALSFPGVYYIDTEGGAQREHYMERLKKSGGKYIGPEDGANDFEIIIGQFKALAIEKHPYKTVVVDSVTKPFITAIATAGEKLGDKNAFGADKKPAVQQMRRLIAAMQRLDMNVIFIAHEVAEWGEVNGQRTEIGKQADIYEKLKYELDLNLQCVKRGPSRTAVVRKTRLLGFPDSETFDLDYAQFATRYGKEVIDRASKQIVLASAAQVEEITRLVDLLKIDVETVGKWYEKANVESYAEFTTEQADKIIQSLKAKIK